MIYSFMYFIDENYISLELNKRDSYLDFCFFQSSLYLVCVRLNVFKRLSGLQNSHIHQPGKMRLSLCIA